MLKKPYVTTNNDDDDEYYDDDEEDYQYNKVPIIKSKYTPMTETMAPRPLVNLTTPRPKIAYFNKNSYETTTWKPFTVTSAQPTTSNIPPIIKFPEDVFQGIKPFGDIPRYLNKSTLRPYTQRQRIKPTEVPVPNPNSVEEIRKTTTIPNTITTTTVTMPTTLVSRTTRKRYTIRPNRGNLKWKTTIAPNVRSNDKKNKNTLELDEQKANRYAKFIFLFND